MINFLGRLLALVICVVHISSCSLSVKKAQKFSPARNPASTVGGSADAASVSDSSAGNAEGGSAQAPVLSYEGATGVIGVVNQPMFVLPTTLNDHGNSITACDVKIPTTTLPAWASVNSTTCEISGTPTGPLTITTYTLTATNSGGTADATVNLTVNAGVPSLSYSGASGTTGAVNQAMSVSPTLNNNGASVTACGIKTGSTNAGSFPGTLSVNASTCVISGTPTSVLSSTSFTLVATNSVGDSPDVIGASVTLAVAAAVPTLSYLSASGTVGSAGQAMLVTPMTLNANGASVTACGIKSGSTNAGSFPGTLSVNTSTCVISGTPTALLSSTAFTLVATNSAGDSSNAAVTLAISAGIPNLSYIGASGTTGTVNQAMSVSPPTLTTNGASITACGIKGGSNNAGSFPGTLSINASTCVISGTPAATLSATAFTLIATNSAGDSSNASVTLTINAVAPILSYSGATGTTGSVGTALSVSPTTLTNNGASITACGIKGGSTNAGSFPGTLSVNASTCVISGTPIAALSTTAFTLVATNSAGTSSDATVTLTINTGAPTLSYAGATGTTGTAGTAMLVSPTTLTDNGASVTACGIKSGSTNSLNFPGTLSVNASTCVISGTPTVTLGITSFTLVATNSVGTSSDATVALSINAAGPVLSYSGATGTTGTIGTALSVSPTTLTNNGASITACGIKGGSTNAGSFPGTLSVNASTCVISGTPSATLSATTFTLIATNSVGNSADATVSLTINPSIVTMQAYLKAPNVMAGPQFGASVVISGDTLVVGAYVERSNQSTITNGSATSTDVSLLGSGAAYVFTRSGTTWSQQAYLKAPNVAANAQFGVSAALSGDTLVVGAYGESSNQSTITNGSTASADTSLSYAGAAYVFTRSGTAWSQQAYLKAPNVAANAYFGRHVSISGDTIVVGVYPEKSNQSTITNGSTASMDTSLASAGAAYVFTRSGTTWSQQAYLKAPNVAAGAYFGSTVSISGDTIVVGSSQEKSNQSTITNGSTASMDTSLSNAGAAYVFTRSGTTWSQQAYLKAPNVGTGAYFGQSVSISGDTIVVGANGEKSNQSTITNGNTASTDTSSSGAGAVYVFTRSGTTWSQQAYLKAPNPAAGANFGYFIAISGDNIAVGAYGERSNQSTITNGSTASANASLFNAGAVYVFTRSGTTWSQKAYIKAPNVGAGTYFGQSLTISGDTIVVGAAREKSNQSTITNGSTASADTSFSDAGAAYVFY